MVIVDHKPSFVNKFRWGFRFVFGSIRFRIWHCFFGFGSNCSRLRSNSWMSGVKTTGGKGEDGPSSSLERAKADDFGRSISKIVVAQICESVGYQGYKESALEALADISIWYPCDLAKNASFHANLAGRTECNVFDITRALEDLGDSHGFPGASETGNCLVDSCIVKGITQFVDTKEEIPFAQPVPKFPVVRNEKLVPSFKHMNEAPPGKHIPSWLPAFPDPHTYNHTPMWTERASNPCADKIERARRQIKAKRALLRLQQRFVLVVCTILPKEAIISDSIIFLLIGDSVHACYWMSMLIMRG